MKELIWYSIPGGIFAFCLYVGFDSTFLQEQSTLIGVASAPVIGFIIHQLFRTIFERRVFASARRQVIRELTKDYPELKDKEPFYVWETVFYSETIKDAFRERHRSLWNYAMSFWTVTLACILSILAFPICQHYFLAIWDGDWRWIGLFLVLGILFLIKGLHTFKDIGEIEVITYRNMRHEFHVVIQKIHPHKHVSEPQEKHFDKPDPEILTNK